ncbi:DUF2249 domain-containing protein [Propioniciclava sinopodophylli]|uniref:DUF2249 domain-containing protein n=1 Tax=Propioniciclava sinopodophylli TaxID=1837344 RepID=A0A4Q9KHC3_9ACTN|nr:DUF2249 domain-containing protein [Propioniciclava sinopodophylli]TBT88769.1 DUF2249 domain-containing protein [Propioniciclava sinopodophylli]
MNDLPITEKKATCGCAHHDEELPVLDARAIPHAIRHAAILGSVASLTPGRALALVAPHDPLPLLAQVREAHGDAIEVTYLEEGPDVWTLKLARV